ncbi:MAG: PQQ-binding-like beta-propeller repeat protein [Thermomicrobiales bacterium]
MLTVFQARAVAVVALVVALVVGSFYVGTGGVAQEATPHPAGPAVPPELTEYAADWPARQGNLAGHRANLESAITADNVGQLEVAWSFAIEAPGVVGGMTAGPLIAGETVYIQDMQSNVFALDRASGTVKWEARYDVPTIGPNGVGLGYGMVYAPLGDTAEVVALNAETGAELWRVQLSANPAEGISIAPVAYDNVLYVSTVPGDSEAFYTGGAKGIVYALDVQTGAVQWQWDTTTDNLWGNPRINSGGGVWYPFSFDDEGNIYFGTGNAGPWPGAVVDGTPYPSGASRPGPNDYASSMVSLDPDTGQLRWHYNANPHDLFDQDFQLTPMIATVTIDGQERTLAIGGGKNGKVVAADAGTGEVVWEVEVGQHNGNAELQEIPEGETIEILPGEFGGIETSMAYAEGVLFVPVVNLPSQFTSTEFVGHSAGLDGATSELVALNVADGSVRWTVEMPTMNVGSATVANDVVFTSGLDGVFRGYHAETGALLWSYQAGSGFNAPAAVAGDLVIVPAAGPLIPAPRAEGATPTAIEPAAELIAFRLPAD